MHKRAFVIFVLIGLEPLHAPTPQGLSEGATEADRYYSLHTGEVQMEQLHCSNHMLQTVRRTHIRLHWRQRGAKRDWERFLQVFGVPPPLALVSPSFPFSLPLLGPVL